jgi:hypothetical protein
MAKITGPMYVGYETRIIIAAPTINRMAASLKASG